MHYLKKYITDKQKFYFMALSAFLITFAVQIIFNLYVIIFRSLPDEMGAVYFASKLVGNDWSYVMTHPAMYYGNMMAFIMYPFFKFVHDPLTLYQCLIGVGAFLRSIPAIICFYISNKYLNIQKTRLSFFLSIACCFFTPTRATNIDNEPGLILCCWLVVLLIMALANTKEKTKKLYLSISLSMVLCISLLAHTRAIVYTISAFIVIFFFHYFTGKALVNYKGFGCSFFVFYLLSKLVIIYWQKTLYPVNEDVVISNTSNALITLIKNGLEKFCGEYGVQSFFDLLASNILVIFVFSSGLAILCFLLFFFHLFHHLKNKIVLKHYVKEDTLFFPLMYCTTGSIIGIVGVCITWIDSALKQHINAENLSRGHFYLRYYSMFFGPLLMLLFGYWIKKEINNKNFKNIFILSIFIEEICMCYSHFSFLSSVAKQHLINSDWFYYFAPFSMKFKQWPNAVQSLEYYITAVRIAIIISILYYYLYKHSKYIITILCIFFISLYQYGYSVLYWDRPFCYSNNYYQSVNALCEFKKEHFDLFNNIDHIYYLNKTYGPQYIVQFVCMQIPVILENPPLTENNSIIISNSIEYVLNSNIIPEEFWYCSLDENEYLLVKGNFYLKLFAQNEIELQPLSEYPIF